MPRGRFTHGKSDSPEHQSWRAMRQRCLNPNDGAYHNYGKRGVTVCDRWRDSFVAFLEDMGPRPSKGHTIDRYPDKNGNYEPGNCRWATRAEQSRNTCRNVILIHNGKSQCMEDWAEELGMDPTKILMRIRAGWNTADTLNPALHNPRQIRGSAVSTARFDDAEVSMIRREWGGDNSKIKEMAARRGVTRKCIREIVTRKTWKHVA